MCDYWSGLVETCRKQLNLCCGGHTGEVTAQCPVFRNLEVFPDAFSARMSAQFLTLHHLLSLAWIHRKPDDTSRACQCLIMS